MNKDTLIGFVLIALVLIGFSWYNQPSAEEIEAARKQDSIAAAIKDNAALRAMEDSSSQPKLRNLLEKSFNVSYCTDLLIHNYSRILK